MARKRDELHQAAEALAPTERRPTIACAHTECERPAIVRQRTATGWANLCLEHYVAHHQPPAEREPGSDDETDPRTAQELYPARVEALLRQPTPSWPDRWKAILANPKAIPIAKELALGALDVFRSRERDQQLAAARRSAPAAPTQAPSTMDVPEDQLEAEFRTGVNSAPADPRRSPTRRRLTRRAV